jgi:membrane-bound serine protease (ClpP class)
MRRTAVAGATLLLAVLAGTAPGHAVQPVSLIELDGAITPITDRLLTTAVERAQADGAQALVVQLNTPGGLERSMRTMAQTILNAGIPVIVYVGRRARLPGSSSPWRRTAAMAPATHGAHTR